MGRGADLGLGISWQFLERVRKSEVRLLGNRHGLAARMATPASPPEENRFQGDALALPTIASQFKIAFHSSR